MRRPGPARSVRPLLHAVTPRRGTGPGLGFLATHRRERDIDDIAARPDTTELRTEVPSDVVDTLDAVSLAQRLTRGQLVVRILRDWAADRHREASLIAKISRVTPAAPADAGKVRA